MNALTSQQATIRYTSKWRDRPEFTLFSQGERIVLPQTTWNIANLFLFIWSVSTAQTQTDTRDSKLAFRHELPYPRVLIGYLMFPCCRAKANSPLKMESTETLDQAALADYVWIDRDEEALALWDDLADQTYLALDTESNSFHGYTSRICLIQIATADTVYLLDTLALAPESFAGLGPILADNHVVKIMHGSDNDLIGFKREFGMDVDHLFDTMIAARYMNFQQRGLDALLRRYFGVHVSKKYQRLNWKLRPIPEDALQYAAGDVSYLLPMYGKMSDELFEMGRWDWVMEDSTLLTNREIPDKAFNPDGFWKMKGSRDLYPHQMAVLRELYLWRHEVCLEEDVAAFLLLDDRSMIEIARARPTSVKQLLRLRGMNFRQVKRYKEELVEVVLDGIEAKPPKQPPRKPRNPKSVPLNEAVYEALRQWRQETAEKDELEIDLVATKQMLQILSRSLPQTMEELEQLSGFTPWRIDRYGPAWLDFIKNHQSSS